MTRRRCAAAFAVVAALAIAPACGGSDSAANANAASGRIHSGVMHVRMELSAGAPAARVGFTLDGPFDLSPANRSLPVADLLTADLSNASRSGDRFLSTGQAAFVVRDGVGYQLTAEQTAPLQGDANASSGSADALAGLDLDHWVVDPQQQGSSSADGTAVDRVTGQVDPVAALNDIVALAGQFGSDQQPLQIDAADADRVRALVQSSSFELLTGHDDHLLRSVTATVELAAPTGSVSGGALLTKVAQLGHVTMTISLQIDGPNQPIAVSAPATVRPISDLPAR